MKSSEPNFTWEDTKTGSRMVFESLEEMNSFLDWRSGKLQEQLEAVVAALRGVTRAYTHPSDFQRARKLLAEIGGIDGTQKS